MVGDGPLRDDVEREIHALGLDDTVHLAGYRTDADALLAAADVACLSSREEGMGSVLLDALAVRRSRRGDARRWNSRSRSIDGECGVLAEPRNPRALGDAIASLLTDPATRARAWRRTARARANEFSVERMSDRTIERL